MGAFIEDLMAGERSAVITTAAAYCLIMGTYSIVVCLCLRSWPSTVAKWNHSGLARFGSSNEVSEQEYHADASYTFEVDGQTYEGNRVSPMIIIASHNARFILQRQMRGIIPVGEDSVKVFYKPSNPKKSYLIIPSMRTIGTLAAVTIGFTVIIYGAI